MTIAPCRECGVAIDPTGTEAVPVLCPTCYTAHSDRIKREFAEHAAEGKDFEELLDILRGDLLDLGMLPETVDRSIDRMRLASTLGLPWEAVANS